MEPVSVCDIILSEVAWPRHQTEYHVHARHRGHQHGLFHLAHVRLVTGLVVQGGILDSLQIICHDRQGRFESVPGVVIGVGAAIEPGVIRIEFPLAV